MKNFKVKDLIKIYTIDIQVYLKRKEFMYIFAT